VFHHAGVEPVAAEALSRFAPEAELVETPGRFGCPRQFAARWGEFTGPLGEQDLVAMEGDKVLTAHTLPQFEDCPAPWCVMTYDNFPAPYTRKVVTGLGCARFRTSVQRSVLPAAFAQGDPPWNWCPYCQGQPPGCWWGLDSRIAYALMSCGIVPHEHGEIEHRHDYGGQDPHEWMAARMAGRPEDEWRRAGG
jgi:hypothetical protein